MGKFEVSLTTGYVKHWMVADAIRELMQNAIDAQNEQEGGHRMSWEYRADEQMLRIQSEGASLDPATLLLGTTTKEGSQATIGHFGEGYKVAALVLLRNGLGLTILNGATGERWTPRLVKSRRYGCEVLTFFTERWALDKRERENLTFEVINLSEKAFEEARHVCLEFSPELSNVLEESDIGQVLDTPIGQQSAVYVGGLFVCSYAPYKHSYNFKPGQLTLDRDRKLASSFDLEWLATRMWLSLPDAVDHVVELVQDGAADVKYITSMSWMQGAVKISQAAWEAFIAKYGADAVPVFMQEEIDRLKGSKYNAILVPQAYRDLLYMSGHFEDVVIEDDREPLSKRFCDWFEQFKALVDSEVEREFQMLINELEELESK